MDLKNFDKSEQIAWNSALPLRDLLHQLDDIYGYQHVNLFAHSMGNIVASNALKLEADSAHPQMLVNAYVASQAAIAAGAYAPILANAPKPIPDLYGNFPTPTGPKPYFFNIDTVASHLYNFFNPRDYATEKGVATWRLNQSSKPDTGYVYAPDDPFRPQAGGTFTRTNVFSIAPPVRLNLNIKTDLYEAFSFAVPAQTSALGAQADVGGPFMDKGGTLNQVDLSQGHYGFTKTPWDHSAQFMGDNAQRRYYWNTLMKSFELGGSIWSDTQLKIQKS